MTGSLIENDFSSYSLAAEEVMEGSILTTLQLQCIQNQIAVLNTDKSAVPYPEHSSEHTKYFTAEAYLRGQIAALKYLKHLSNSYVQARAEAAQNQE